LASILPTMKNKVFFACLIAVVTACSSPKYKNPHVAIKTQFGDIEVELYPDQAPKSVAAFLSYVDAGYYERASFYRVLNEDNQPTGNVGAALIQGGIYKNASLDTLKITTIPHETTAQTKILHTNGTLSLARQAPGTASTEFFICVGDQPGFDYGGENNSDKQGYAAFGKVIKGMDVVIKIYGRPSNGEMLVPEVLIQNIERL